MPELVSFLEYVGNPSETAGKEDFFVRSLETQIAAIKRDREWRGRYMLLELTIARERKDAREEGLTEGKLRQLIEQCCRKLAKGRSAEEIADALECDLSKITPIIDAAQKLAPNYDVDSIYEALKKRNNRRRNLRFQCPPAG